MTLPLVPPDRGWSTSQRLLPDSSDLEETRRALNRVYDQIDRMTQSTTDLQQTIAPTVQPSTPGGVANAYPSGPTSTGPTTTPGGSTGSVTPTPAPVTLWIPSNVSGALSIDQRGYVALESVTV